MATWTSSQRRQTDNKITWHENDGGQNFTEQIVSSTTVGPRDAYAIDLDGDGDMDVVSAAHGSDQVAWHENDGNENFSTHRVDGFTGVGAYGIFSADMDGDGDLDVLAAAYQENKITWYENNATSTLDSISDLTVDEDAPEQTVDLTGITAGGGETQNLAGTAVSSNTDLVADPTVVYTSAEVTGQLKFTPLADQHGTSTITVTVEDGGLDNDLDTAGDNATFSRTFDVTVNPVNDDPTLVQPDNVTVDEDASEQTVNLSGITAGGGETQPLRVTAISSNTELIADPTVVYTSAEVTGSLKFTPLADQHGFVHPHRHGGRRWVG